MARTIYPGDSQKRIGAWTSFERSFLVQLVKDNYETIESPSLDDADKHECWEKMYKRFNGVVASERGVEACKSQWTEIKFMARHELVSFNNKVELLGWREATQLRPPSWAIDTIKIILSDLYFSQWLSSRGDSEIVKTVDRLREMVRRFQALPDSDSAKDKLLSKIDNESSGKTSWDHNTDGVGEESQTGETSDKTIGENLSENKLGTIRRSGKRKYINPEEIREEVDEFKIYKYEPKEIICRESDESDEDCTIQSKKPRLILTNLNNLSLDDDLEEPKNSNNVRELSIDVENEQSFTKFLNEIIDAQFSDEQKQSKNDETTTRITVEARSKINESLEKINETLAEEESMNHQETKYQIPVVPEDVKDESENYEDKENKYCNTLDHSTKLQQGRSSLPLKNSGNPNKNTENETSEMKVCSPQIIFNKSEFSREKLQLDKSCQTEDDYSHVTQRSKKVDNHSETKREFDFNLIHPHSGQQKWEDCIKIIQIESFSLQRETALNDLKTSELKKQIAEMELKQFQIRMVPGGEPGSGAGQGGGGGGSIRSAGGAFGKMEQAHEDQYFYNLQKEQLKKMKEGLHDEISFHEEQIKRHQEAISRHKQRLTDMDKAN